MSILARLDPELAPVVEAIPPEGLFDLRDIPGARAQAKEMLAALAAQLPPLPVDVQITNHEAPGPDGAPAVRVRVYTPQGHSAPLPALLWIHGGGYVLGSVEMEDHRLAELARTIPCIVASVEYRLAPEHPFPAPLDDCYAGLRWMHREADSLGVDASRIAIGRASAERLAEWHLLPRGRMRIETSSARPERLTRATHHILPSRRMRIETSPSTQGTASPTTLHPPFGEDED